jgi:hypothetical protein
MGNHARKKSLRMLGLLNAQNYAPECKNRVKGQKENPARNTTRPEHYLLCAGIHIMVFLVVHERVGEYKQAVARKIRRSTYRL